MHLAIGEDKFINIENGWEGMVSEELLAYIRALLRNGYTPEQVRQSLAGGGYAPADIDDAFRAFSQEAALAPSSGHSTFWILGAVLGLAVGGIIMALLLSSGGSSAAVTLLSRPVQVEVLSGSSLGISNTITAQDASLTLVQTLIDTDGTAIASSRSEADVKGRKVVSTTLGIPTDISSGRYAVKVSAIDAEGAETTAQFYITVQQRKTPQPQAPANATPGTTPSTPTTPTPVTPTPTTPGTTPGTTPEEAGPPQCAGGCNDYDPTTEDDCVNGACQHTAKPAACGNGVCDGEETSSACPQDCGSGTNAPSADQVIEQARATAPDDNQRAMGLCGALPRPQDADRCKSVVASSADQSTLCSGIGDDVTRDQCYIDFAIRKNEFDVCEKIANRYLRGSCNSLRNLRQLELQRETEPAGLAVAGTETVTPTTVTEGEFRAE